MAERIRILGRELEVELRPGRNPKSDRDGPALMAALNRMAAAIDAGDWDPDQAEGFRSLSKLVMFSREVQNYGWLMSRSGCDVARGVFYWKIREFAGHPDPIVHAHTLFHDGWHVVQHLRQDGYPKDLAEQVAREVDAIDRQVVVARKLGCEERKVEFLIGFGADPERIAARIQEGVRRARRRVRKPRVARAA